MRGMIHVSEYPMHTVVHATRKDGLIYTGLGLNLTSSQLDDNPYCCEIPEISIISYLITQAVFSFRYSPEIKRLELLLRGR